MCLGIGTTIDIIIRIIVRVMGTIEISRDYA